jgi:hypothetical protein
MMRPGRRIASLLFLLPYLRRYAWRVTGASAALLVAAGLVLLLGQGVRHLIDHGFAGHDPATLNRAAAAMFLVVAALAVATYARFYLVSWLGERTAADLRRDVFNHVIGLSPSYFETARTGDVLSRMTADISVLQALIGSAISMAIRNVLLLAGALVMLVATSAKLAGVIVVVVPVVVVPLILFGRRERRLSRVAQDRVGDLGAYAEETINALATVQAFTHEAVDRSLFSLRVEQSVGAALRRIRTRAWLILVVILLGFGAITFSLWIGGRDVMAGRMSGGDLSAFVFYAVLLATSGATLSEVWGEMQRAAGAADRLIELLDEKPGIAAPPDAAAFPVPARGTIALENVRSTGFRFMSIQARPWRWLAPPAPANPRSFNFCFASTMRNPALCGSTAWMSAGPILPRYGPAWRWWRRIRLYSAPMPGKTSATGGRMPAMPRWRRRWRRHRRNSSRHCPKAWIRSWAKKVCGFPAVSGSAWPLRGRYYATRRSCFWMRRRARWMRNRNRRCNGR